MSLVFSALAPVFVIILFGDFLKRQTLIYDSFWAPAEKITFFYFFPSLLLANTAKAELASIPVAPIILATKLGILIIAAITL